MPRTFKGKALDILRQGKAPKGFPADLIRSAQLKLFMLENAAALSDLKAPPGNRLEALHGDREGQHSIRVNDKWRFCFVWNGTQAVNIELVDYH